MYFLDRVRDGVWRLEVYPDAVPVLDPFEPPSPDKIVTRAIARPWPMTVRLSDLGDSFSVQPVAAGTGRVATADAGRFQVRPGVYVLSADGPPRFRVAAGAIGQHRVRGVSCTAAREAAAVRRAAAPFLVPCWAAGRNPRASRRHDAA